MLPHPRLHALWPNLELSSNSSPSGSSDQPAWSLSMDIGSPSLSTLNPFFLLALSHSVIWSHSVYVPGIPGAGDMRHKGRECHRGMNKPLRCTEVTEATEALTQPPGSSTQGSN